MRISEEEARNRLNSGEVIALPTDTVFGLAVQANNEEALRQLLAIKKRPTCKPFVTLLSRRPRLRDFLRKSIYLPSDFRVCIDAFWPGPCTMLLPKSKLSDTYSIYPSFLGFSGFRVPYHPDLQTFLDKTGNLVVSSANISGDFPAVSCEEVENTFGKDFPCLDFGTNRTIGLESTIIKITSNNIEIMREGLLPFEEVCLVCGQPELKCTNIYMKKSVKQISWINPNEIHRNEGLLLGFSNRDYPSWPNHLAWGNDSSIEDVLSNFYPVLRGAFASFFNEIFLDSDWPKGSPLWEVLRRKLLGLTYRNGNGL
ncbi:L-threonylcarbamoyladenylate synthase [Candidatus Similichlamydia epinepheli]|uniref:L-threonylcarbamoyladenylate synthase n=1 Tax=Candidatus Similichlamydia epinepheli TaxID=1903953 RepID=UPI000D339522|nr:L-threonylcarbamoyladenylate synthase [Candidatus Similichlamydia epinepheli]